MGKNYTLIIGLLLTYSLYSQRCPMIEQTSLVGKTAPDFTADAVIDGEIKKVSLFDFKTKFKVLVFYPADFTMVCPTELRALQEKLGEFDKRDAQILGISVDNAYVHKAWLDTPKDQAGIKGVTYPLISDLNKTISCMYQVLDASGVAQRGIFVLDEKNVIQYMSINNLSFGRNIDEIIRIIEAISFTQQNSGKVCPVGWQPGKDTMEATQAGAKKYFQEQN